QPFPMIIPTTRPVFSWENTTLTPDTFHRIAEIRSPVTLILTGTNYNPADLAPLAGMTNLTYLLAPVVDRKGLQYLGELPNLTDLMVARVTSAGDGLKHLGGLSKLTRLELERFTEGDGGGLEHLARLTNLTRISLNFKTMDADQLKHLGSLTKLTHLRLTH